MILIQNGRPFITHSPTISRLDSQVLVDLQSYWQFFLLLLFEILCLRTSKQRLNLLTKFAPFAYFKFQQKDFRH